MAGLALGLPVTIAIGGVSNAERFGGDPHGATVETISAAVLVVTAFSSCPACVTRQFDLTLRGAAGRMKLLSKCVSATVAALRGKHLLVSRRGRRRAHGTYNAGYIAPCALGDIYTHFAALTIDFAGIAPIRG